ncbi:MAG: hypothetical protein R3245_06895 [Kiloniellales bacterium]|nr:hypothetical protein [Kiloniellales bacterium]
MPFFMPGNGGSKRRKPTDEPPAADKEHDGMTAGAFSAHLDRQAPPGSDLTDHEPLPLEDAAIRLGITSDELKRRFRTGDFRGFVQGGRLFVYVPEAHADDAIIAEAPRPTEPRRAEESTGASGNSTVIEFQKIEINRLIKANKELANEKERLYRLLEREQVLRQSLQRSMEQAWQKVLLAPSADIEDEADQPIELGGMLNRKD